MAVEFKVPELEENVEKGDVVRVMVKAGDVVAVDQPIFELETDKATIEVPSTVSGKISNVAIKAGDKVKPGQLVLTVDDGSPAMPGEREGGGVQRLVRRPEVRESWSSGGSSEAKTPTPQETAAVQEAGGEPIPGAGRFRTSLESRHAIRKPRGC